MVKSLEGIFTSEELTQILIKASALQELDNSEKRGLIERRLLEVGETLIGFELAYEATEDLGIPRKYFDMALKLVDLPLEEQLADLKKYGAVPTVSVFVEDYRKKFGKELNEHYPLWDFRSDVNLNTSDNRAYSNIDFYKLENRRLESIIGKSKRKLAKLAIEGRGGDSQIKGLKLKLDLFDPHFIAACGQRFEELNEIFSEYISAVNVVHHYGKPLIIL